MKILTRTASLITTLLFANGCASQDFGSSNLEEAVQGDYSIDEYSRFVTIYPSNDTAPDGSVTLAQRFLLNIENTRFILQPSVLITGNVMGWYSVENQGFAPTPGESAPVADAIINFQDPTAPADRTTITDDKGQFLLHVVPSTTGTIQILPSVPSIPPLSIDASTLGKELLSIDLGTGYPIFGWITDVDDDPIASVEVSAAREDGLQTASTFTDDFGYYQLKVPDGNWIITAHGRANERDPTLVSDTAIISSNSAQVDLYYHNLELLSIGGRVVTENGSGVGGATVTMTSESLDSYNNQATMTTSVICNANGYFDTRVLSGSYHVVATPPEEEPLQTGLTLFSVEPKTTNLPDLTLNSFVESLGLVTDSLGAPIPSTAVTLQETQGLLRTWTAYSDKTGLYYATLPVEPIIATLTPPENNLGLATTILLYTPIEEEVATLPISNGYLLTGTALGISNNETMPLEYAWVEITNTQGDILANTITNINGDFEVRLAD
jgi:hypothetical protein